MPVVVQQTYQLAFGKMNISRGTGVIIDEFDEKKARIKLYSWDVLPLCRSDNCPAANFCHYLTGKAEPERCWVIGKYIKHTVDVIFGNIGDRMTEAQLFRVGTGLIPLYRNLARLKIEEAGMVSPVALRKGMTPQPIYKEIRATIKDIEALWKSIGIENLDFKYNMPSGVEFSTDGGEGDSYYDQLEKGVLEDSMKDVTPKKKKAKKLKLRRSVFNRKPLMD
ncbi:MAG: hypothetical protein SVK08_01935 [Halobacteriota archaeon]|nr:hypothetical protein [Halobacteriota archaeon]